MGGTISCLTKNNGRSISTPSNRIDSGQSRRRVNNGSKELGSYLPLYKAALKGDWKEAKTFIDENPGALTTKITIASETALHIAVGTGKDISFVDQLVKSMSPEELALSDHNGETALFVAAIIGNLDAAKIMVNKNPNLPNIASHSDLPIHRAAQNEHHDMIRYLMSVTRKDIEPNPFFGELGVKLLKYVIVAEFYDLALELVNSYPDMATVELSGFGSALDVLAEKPSTFPSGSHVRWWQYFMNTISCGKYYRDKMMKHDQALKLVKRLCMEIVELDDANAFKLLQPPLHLAAELGVHEIIEEIVETFPPAIWFPNKDNHNVFQIAVMHRQKNVFNLIHQMSEYKHLVRRCIDPQNNNILHLAAKLPPSDRLNIVSGAALQMQHEYAWFKAVEKLAQHVHITAKSSDGKTPATIFREEHIKLVEEGEKWMKTTASSCTVVAASVVFNAALKVPSGTNMTKPKAILMVLSASDVFSLFFAVSSISLFLSILTSRYSESDFLTALPLKLIAGLIMLLLSIITMMLAVVASLFSVFEQGPGWWDGLVIAFTVMTGGLFVCLQCPLLKAVLVATNAHRKFGRQSSRSLN